MKKLYDQLFADGDFTGTFEDFKKQYGDANKSKALFNALEESGDYTQDFESFNSQFGFKPAKTEAVATETAPVTAVNEAVDTELASGNGSSESQEPDPKNPFDQRFLDFASGYDKDKGKSRLHEDAYLTDWAGKPTGKGGVYPTTFEGYAESLGTTLRQEYSEQLDEIVISATKSDKVKSIEKKAEVFRNRISEITALTSASDIGMDYYEFEDKGGYITPKLEEKETSPN